MRIVVLVVLAFFAVAGHASAEPFVIGEGHTPAVAVDAAGTAYIAWNGSDSADTPEYCRLPRGATECDVALTLPIVPGTISTARPHVSLVGGRVSILVWRTGQATGITQYFSTDGGESFAARTAGGNVGIYESADGPGDTVSVVTNADGRGGLFQSVPLGGGTATGIATLDAARPYNGSVGLDGANPVVTYGTSVGDQVRFRRYTGAGDINVAANWSAPVEIGYASYPRLAGGRLGLFLLGGDADGGLFVRRFTGGTFGAPVAITAEGDSSEMSLHQDPGGRLHAVYPSLDAEGYHAQYAVSDDGVNWTTTELAASAFTQPGDMRVAAAADHVGVAVAELGTEILAAAVAPTVAPPPPQQPQPQPQPPAPTPTPIPTPQPPADPVAEFAKTVVVQPTGTVRLRLKGSSRFVALTALDDVPFGATLDTKRGAVILRAQTRRGRPVETIRLSDGMFSIGQSANVVNFTLNEPLAKCPKRASAAAQKKPKSRKLWGDGKGAFRTSGKYSAATVRGTRWLVQDTCAGTLTRVTQGSVNVRDKVRGRTIVVRAGRSYTARPRR